MRDDGNPPGDGEFPNKRLSSREAATWALDHNPYPSNHYQHHSWALSLTLKQLDFQWGDSAERDKRMFKFWLALTGLVLLPQIVLAIGRLVT